MYYYQVDGNEPDTAWKYRGEVPDTQDYPLGKYSYFNGINYWEFELVGEEGNPGIQSSTLKESYSFYVIFDSNNMTVQCHMVNKSTLEDTALGNPEPVTAVSTKSEDATLINAQLKSLGKWNQTIYIGSTKETAQDCTLETGSSITGVLTTEDFIRFIGTEELTCDKKQIRPAINALYNDFEVLKELVPTKTEVNKNLENYVNKDSILLAKSDTATDNELYSAKTINTELDGAVKKTDIVTALDDTVTDEQVTSALLTKTELDKLSTSLGELSDSLVDIEKKVFKYSGIIEASTTTGYVQINNPLGVECNIICSKMYVSGSTPNGLSITGQTTTDKINIYVRNADGTLPPDGTSIKVAFILF